MRCGGQGFIWCEKKVLFFCYFSVCGGVVGGGVWFGIFNIALFLFLLCFFVFCFFKLILVVGVAFDFLQ